MADCISIITDNETFEFSPVNEETGRPMTETTFILRIVPDDKMAQFRRECTHKVFDRRSRAMVDQVDDVALAAAILDYAIVSWRGIRNARTSEALLCSAELKALLPEKVKTEVLMLAAAKEGGAAVAAEQEKKRSASISSGSATSSPA